MAKASSNGLGKQDGKPVVRATAAVTNAGDGLSDSLGIEPVVYPQGSTVYVVLECEVRKVRFEPIKDDEDELQRVHILKAGTATIMDDAVIRDAIRKQAEAIQIAREQEQGIQRLALAEEERDLADAERGK